MDINTVFIGLYTLLRYFGKYKKKYIFTDAHISALGGHYQNAKMVITLRITLQADPRYQPGIKIRFSNARQTVRYYQIFTGHFKNPSDIMFGNPVNS